MLKGSKAGKSHELLVFECGGRQFVKEFTYPVLNEGGTYQDVEFLQDFVKIIEENHVPALAPLEQRWSTGSK